MGHELLFAEVVNIMLGKRETRAGRSLLLGAGQVCRLQLSVERFPREV